MAKKKDPYENYRKYGGGSASSNNPYHNQSSQDEDPYKNYRKYGNTVATSSAPVVRQSKAIELQMESEYQRYIRDLQEQRARQQQSRPLFDQSRYSFNQDMNKNFPAAIRQEIRHNKWENATLAHQTRHMEKDRSLGYVPEPGTELPDIDILRNQQQMQANRDRNEQLQRQLWGVENAAKYADIEQRATRINPLMQKPAPGNSDAARGSRGETYVGMPGTQGSRNDFMGMTEQQRQTYAYLANTKGQEEADKYAQFLSYSLNAQQRQKEAQRWGEIATKNGWTGAAASALSVGSTLMSGIGLVDATAQRIGNALRNDGEYRPVDFNRAAMAPTFMTQGIRGSISQQLNGNGEKTINLDPQKHPIASRILNGKGWGDVYQLGMSMVDSSAIAGIGALTGMGATGTILLGGSAGSQGMLDALAKGANDTQAISLGIANGVFEALFEYVSLDKLMTSDPKNIILGFLQQGFIEGSEELSTSFANGIADIAVMMQHSDWEAAMDDYMKQGMTREQAWDQVFIDTAISVGWDFAGGMITGGLMELGKAGTGATSNYFNGINANAAAAQQNIGSLMDAARIANPESTKRMDRIQGRMDAGKKVSKTDAYRLSRNEAASRNVETRKLTQAVRGQLEGNADAEILSRAIVKQVTGDRLSSAERNLLNASSDAKAVAEQITDTRINSGLKPQWAADVDFTALSERYGNPELVESAGGMGEAQEYFDAVQAMKQTMQQSQQSEEAQEAAEPVSNTEQFENSEQLEEQSGETGELEEVQPLQETVTPATDETLAQAAQQYGAQAAAFRETYQAGQDLEQYSQGFQRVFDAGRAQMPLAAANNLDTAQYLTEDQRKAAHAAGVAASNQEATERDNQNRSQANGKTGHREGVVKGEGVNVADLTEAFNDQQHLAYKVMSFISKATGIDVVMFQSKTDANGNYVGENGRFSHKDNTIYVDINSGLLKGGDVSDLGKFAMLRTFTHEFCHFIEKWSAVRYNELRAAVFQAMHDRGVNVDDLIEEKMSTYSNLTYEKASREVVAEALADILPDSKFVNTLAEQHKNIFQKLLDKIKEYADNLREYFRNLGQNRSREAAALKEQVDGQIKYLDSIIELFDKAAVDAVNTYQTTIAEFEQAEETTEAETVEVEPEVTEEPAPVEETPEPVEEAPAPAEESPKPVEEAPAPVAEAPAAQETAEEEQKPAAEPRTIKSEHGFTAYENAQFGSVEVSFQEKPSAAVRQALKDNKFRWNGKRSVWYGKTSIDTIVDALNNVYQQEAAAPAAAEPAKAEEKQPETMAEQPVTQETEIREEPTPVKEETKNEEVQEPSSGNGDVREDHEGAVLQPEPDGEGAARPLDEGKAEDVQGAGGQREAASPDSGRGRTAERDGDRADSADRSGGSQGAGEGGNLRGVTEETETAKKKQLEQTAKEQTEQKSTANPKGSNFVIDESLNLPSGEKARFRANMDALRLIKTLENEGRLATPAEQEVLSKYVGWGGLSNAFGEMRYNRETGKREMVAKTGWSKEFAEFQQLITDGVITQEEYDSMSKSTMNAHYTSIEVVKAMYDGLAKLGFKGGRMLEPSSGVGNFVGGMPAAMTKNVKSWTMVELDRITGQIARNLYPNADVRIQGFETANIPDNYMDVAIGNVPFGNYGVVDNTYPKRITKTIHNYFFAKSLDKVRPGGVVMFITSSFTMNGQDTALRQYIMDRADLLGAIRLPNTAFSGNAGTSVVTDILVLQKRKPGTEYGGEKFLEAPAQQIDAKNWVMAYINEYFTNHPEMVLGEAAAVRGMYGPDALTYNPLTENGPLGDQIRKAFENIKGQMDYTVPATPEKTNFAAERANKKTKKNGLEVKDGKVYRNVDGNLEEVQVDDATAKRVSGLLGIRDAYRDLVNYLQQGQSAETIKEARDKLNTLYDQFVKKYGMINSPKNKSAIADDPDSYSLLSLENYDSESKTATKADIFAKDTIKPNRTVDHVDDVSAGVIVSVNTTGGVDADLIARLTGKSVEDVTRELIDTRAVFKTPGGDLETPAKYLSGNVRAKLQDAEALAPMDHDFQNNVEELRKVLPKDIPFDQIYAAVGTPWIPNDVYADFIAEMLGGYNYRYSGPDVTVTRTNTGDFKIDLKNKRLKDRYQNTQEYGTSRKSFVQIISAMMTNGSLTIKDAYEDIDGKTRYTVNKVETAAVNEKAEAITRAFKEWLWKDESRRDTLAKLYNETFNSMVTPKFSGENLTVNGLNAEFTIRPHQADAVQRIISSGGNTLLAHRVGAGKTMEMAAAAMKLRELGIVKKPVFVVPKSVVAQWGVEFKSYFPAAKLLVSDEKSFSKGNRKVFINKIANGDYDAIILTYEQFEKVPMSAEYQKQFYQQQIDEILDAIAEEKAENGGRSLSVKDMEKRKAQLEKKVASLTTKAKDEDNVDFESLGIDSLFVDEAHNFKNLQYVSRMQNVSGLGNTTGSQRAFDLYTKVRYLQGLNGGRGVVFATATPVMNSMAEMYIMQKYLQSDLLDRLGLKTFDAWSKQFGEVVNSLEIKPSGQGFRMKQTFSNFRNLGELQMLFRSFADVMTKVPGLKIPKMKGGKVNTVICEPGEFQQEYMKALEKRADNVRNVDPSVDNMLKITSDGRKVSYTQRMIDPSLPYEDGCKIKRCCENVFAEYQASSGINGTQVVFCDMATPKGKSDSAKASADSEVGTEELDTESAKLYDDMKALLVKKGIPAAEIAFIHDAKTDAQRKQLFADVNSGKVRVLIGSTGKMGVGMNAQKRIVAIHHLDAPWRPGDVEQRDGRAFRQGNINDEVSKYTYVTEGSFDARLWDILDRKQHFIEQIMNGENIGRSVEDTGEVTLSAAEVKALASGNPMIMEQVQLTNEISKLSDLKRAHESGLARASAKARDDEVLIRLLESRIANAGDDILARKDTYSGDNFSIVINGKTVTDKKAAGVLLAAAISKAEKGETITVGSFAGFEIKATKTNAEYFGMLSGKNDYRFAVNMESSSGMITRIINAASGLESEVERCKKALTELKADLAAQGKILQEPFTKQSELDAKKARLDEIMAILNPKEEQTMGDSEDDDEDQYQQRTSPLTDREVLEIAAGQMAKADLSESERNALVIFQDKLNALHNLQDQRQELGRLYKEQRFTKGGDKAEAEKTLDKMRIMDGKISRASDDVLKVEQAGVLREVLHRSRGVVETLERNQANERLRRYRDQRLNAKAIKHYRDGIVKEVDTMMSWINKPSSKDALKHVPDVLKDSVIPFLSSIDQSSKRRLGGGDNTKNDNAFLKNLQAMQRKFTSASSKGDLGDLEHYISPRFAERMNSLTEAVEQLVADNSGEFVLNRMTSEELQKLYTVVRNLKKMVTMANRLHQNAVFAHVSEAGEDSITSMQTLDDSKGTNPVSNYLMWQQIRPAYAFERFGDGGKSIYDELRGGQAKLAFHTKEIQKFAESAYKPTQVKAWEKAMKTVTFGGENVQVPVSYLMSLYLLNKREQARSHLFGNGVRVAAFKNGKQSARDVGHKVTESEINDAINQLTAEQKAIADKLQRYMQEVGGKWGNQVSQARFGEDLFGEDHYFPINSDGMEFGAKVDEHPQNASFYALLNMGFTKSLQEEAKTRLILFSVFDVFANHMASMAQYNAFALPVLDAVKWLNYRQVEDAMDTTIEPSSVREQMARAFGTPTESKPGSGMTGYAETFVKNIIKAFNGTEAQGVPSDSMGVDALHRYNITRVAYNLRVAMQQPLAITRAAMLLDYGSIMRGMRLSPSEIKKNTQEMLENSGIAAWKDLGFYDVNISRGLTDIIKHKSDFMDKVDNVGMWAAEKADSITWTAIWSASKEQVKKRGIKPTDANFLKETTKLFEDVIYKTQVVDSILTKNEFLRSKGWWARAIGSFMSEPTTTASMVIDAYDKYSSDLQRGYSKEVAWQRNKGNITRTTAVYCISAFVLAAVTGIADAWRDDDRYQNPLQKWAEAFGGNLVDELMPLNKLPIFQDVYEMVKRELDALGFDTYGNEPRSIIFQWQDSLIKASEIIHDKISGEKTNYTWYGGIYKMLDALSGASGVPGSTLTREVINAWNNVIGGMAPGKVVRTYQLPAKSEIKYAYLDGFLSEDEAEQELWSRSAEISDINTQDDAYWEVRNWVSGTNSNYTALKDALASGEGVQEAIDELLEHGYDQKKVTTKIRTEIGNMFKAGEIDQKKALELLMQYGDLKKADAQKRIDGWK